MKTHKTLEDFIHTTRDLVSEDKLGKLLGAIILESLDITRAQGGKVYLPDITKQCFDLSYIVFYPSVRPNRKDIEHIDLLSQLSSSMTGMARHSVSRVQLKSNSTINSSNYLVYSAITGKQLKLEKIDNFSSYQTQQLEEFDQSFLTRTDNVLVVPLCNHEGSTIGLLELFNYDASFNNSLLNAFTSLAAVLINNAHLVSQNKHLIRILDENNQKLESENNRLKKNIEQVNQYEIIGESKAVKSVFSLLDRISDSNVTVLLRGETGTGKEVFARAVHKNSQRKNAAFVTQNCAALPENLLESELFGYKKGAFTGAVQDKTGLFDQANGGTLFLDEIGDMPVNLQAKVLRVIQEQEVRPLGADCSHKVDVRIIAATHCDLEEKISAGTFRQDLYYRLNIFPLTLPRLKDRENDVVLLIHHFVSQYNKLYQREIDTISPGVIDCLSRYDYPGNVRELQNIVERAVLLCHDQHILMEEHLPVEITRKQPQTDSADTLFDDFFDHTFDHHFAHDINNSIDSKVNNLFNGDSLKTIIRRYEASLIRSRLKANDWNQTATAQMLKMPRRTLVEKISRLNIEIPKQT